MDASLVETAIRRPSEFLPLVGHYLDGMPGPATTATPSTSMALDIPSNSAPRSLQFDTLDTSNKLGVLEQFDTDETGRQGGAQWGGWFLHWRLQSGINPSLVWPSALWLLGGRSHGHFDSPEVFLVYVRSKVLTGPAIRYTALQICFHLELPFESRVSSSGSKAQCPLLLLNQNRVVLFYKELPTT